ncbi:MAG: YciI family protein [Betaproteobacteria bacterium]
MINLLLAVTLAIAPITSAAQDKSAKDVRFVVVHSVGPNWKPGVPAFEQEGLRQHVGHYAGLLKSGKLLMGGPFMDQRSGGIMIAQPDVTEDELRKFAAEDPAVKSGLLMFEVRPWLVGLHQ